MPYFHITLQILMCMTSLPSP